MSDNPLLSGSELPLFDRITAAHVEPAMREVLTELGQRLDRLESQAKPEWDALVRPLVEISDRLERTWGAVGHLLAVQNSPELRTAYETIEPDVVRLHTRIAQSKPIYEAFRQLNEREGSSLTGARQRIVEAAIRDAELSGVALEGAAKEAFEKNELELAELSTRFSNNVLDATKAFALDLTERDEVAGLPPSALSLASQSARESGHESSTPEAGPWRFTLDIPSLMPFLMHARRRDLREKMMRAHLKRASEEPLDNGTLIERILELRQAQARLLGLDSYAEKSLASKMAPDVATVEGLLEQLREASWESAQQDHRDLIAFARDKGAPEADDLRHWDIGYWAERLREERYAFQEEELRPYFQLPKVLEGLFALAERLFGVRVEAADGEAPVWHPDVRFFRVRDADGSPLAAFYLDPYSRPSEKRGGAWMNECVGRSATFAPPGQAVRLPVAHLVCNQTPPVDNKPSLMTFREVETLFHEFGHGLQHMLTAIDEDFASGIRGVEWDAVELPSQFMENWCYHQPTLMGLTAHVETGEPLPQALFEKIVAARNYRAASQMLRQLQFGFVDLELHHRHRSDGDESPLDIQRRIQKRLAIIEPLAEDRFLCSFGHIFSGGYAAGYYSYKWAEVLSADAFGAFEEAGLEDPDQVAATGRRFRETVLATGGAEHPLEVFKKFRGREPSPEALLRHQGLAPHQ